MVANNFQNLNAIPLALWARKKTKLNEFREVDFSQIHIAFIGGDDLFLPKKISGQVEWLEADEQRVMCGHQVDVFYEDGSPSHKHMKFLRSGVGPRQLIQKGLPFSALSVMVRANRVPAGGFNHALPLVSDGLFFTEILIPTGVYGYIEFMVI